MTGWYDKLCREINTIRQADSPHRLASVRRAPGWPVRSSAPTPLNGRASRTGARKKKATGGAPNRLRFFGMVRGAPRRALTGFRSGIQSGDMIGFQKARNDGKPAMSPTALDTSRLIEEARAFLEDLSRNNSRDWFQAHKARYDTRLKRPAEVLLAQIGFWLDAQSGPVRGKLFRPQRDLRFSPDKTPYHTHLHMMWSKTNGQCWVFGIAPGYVSAGAGIMAFDPKALPRFRTAAAAAATGERLQEVLENGGWRLDPPQLQRVPAPWPANHPREALLRRKGLVVWDDHALADGSGDPRAALQACFARMQPLQIWLAETVTAPSQ